MKSLKILFICLILFFTSHQIVGQQLNFEFNKISEIRNGYTLQSNGSPQQLWIDPQNSEFLHAVFINSQFKTYWPDRTCLYFGSSDFGQNWFEFGSVPDTSRSGFPAISGTNDGAAIIVNHSNYFGTPTRTGLYIDNSSFEYNFAAFDPGTSGSPVSVMYPKFIVTEDGNILITAISDSLLLNYFDIATSTFSGWNALGTSYSDAYSFSVSDGGKIGFTFISGQGIDEGDVIYLESTDNGLTWGQQIKIFDCPAEQGIAVGALRGISLNFYGEEPCIVFETCQQDFSTAAYYPRLPNQILFWSPNINSGDPKIIADSSNVPFAPSLNPETVLPPLCRPVIGRSSSYNGIFIAFSAATENVFVGTDSTSYFAGYFMTSWDGGNTWLTGPEKITPDFPLLNWNYISIAPINPFIGEQLYVHLVLQADSLEASQIPSELSAQYYHAVAWVLSIGVDDDLPTAKDFRLFQNYPNPFNPSTKIYYHIAQTGFVKLAVYDILGNEVETLVNEEKHTGSYEVNFDATGLSSGIYFYKIQVGDFVQTKKMILLK